MAEENKSLPVKLEPLSREKFNSRRFSTGTLSSSLSVPRYLRASTGSCHDNCKSGKSYSPEPNIARTTFFKKLIKRPAEDEILMKRVVFPEGIKKSPVNRPKSLSSSEILVHDSPDNIVRRKAVKPERRNLVRVDHVPEKKVKNPAGEMKPSLKSASHSPKAKYSMKKGVLSTNEALKKVLPTNGTSKRAIPTKETSKHVPPTSVTLKRALSSPAERKPSGSLVLSHNSSSSNLGRLSASTDSLLQQSRDDIKAREITMAHRRGASKISPLPLSSASSSSKASTGPKVAVNKVPRALVSRRMFNGASPTKNTKKVENVEVGKVSNGEEVTEKSLYSVRAEETESRSSEAFTNENIDEVVVMSAEESEDKPSKPVPTLTIADSILEFVEETETAPVIANDNIAYSINEDAEETNDFESCEPVTKQSVEESLSPSLPETSTSSPVVSTHCPSLQEEDHTESEYTGTESDDYSCSEYEESDLIQAGETSDGEGKNKIRKGRDLMPENEGSEPMKLQFRRGRIIDVQHDSDNPRRLRFRRGRMLEETRNMTSESRRRRERIKVESRDDNIQEGSTKVVLRHSDVQEKKDGKGLFNNVIEETASKLVETRKSKVKALVGAFETVISLQDKKPTASVILE